MEEGMTTSHDCYAFRHLLAVLTNFDLEKMTEYITTNYLDLCKEEYESGHDYGYLGVDCSS